MHIESKKHKINVVIGVEVIGQAFLKSCPEYMETGHRTASEWGTLICSAIQNKLSTTNRELTPLLTDGLNFFSRASVNDEDWSISTLKREFGHATGAMFGGDNYGIFKEIFGMTCKEYRHQMLQQKFEQFKADVEVICKSKLCNVKVSSLPNCDHKGILTYDCKFAEFAKVIEKELETDDSQFNHLVSVFRYVSNIAKFIEEVYNV